MSTPKSPDTAHNYQNPESIYTNGSMPGVTRLILPVPNYCIKVINIKNKRFSKTHSTNILGIWYSGLKEIGFLLFPSIVCTHGPWCKQGPQVCISRLHAYKHNTGAN